MNDAAEVLEQARALLSYDPLTGLFVRIKNQGGTRGHLGAVAGSFDGKGYIRIAVAGREHRAHRLAWLMSYGEWPKETIDHINRIKTDNRLSNLRDVSLSENVRNVGLLVTNASGYKGVNWDKKKSKWEARIKRNGKKHWLGYFSDPAQAHAAYLLAAETLEKQDGQ